MDRFSLLSEDTITLQNPLGTTIDEVSYAANLDFPDQIGRSVSLSPNAGHTENDLGLNWCYPSSIFGIGDYGTPGQQNDECGSSATLADISEGDILISEIMHSPSKVLIIKENGSKS